MERILLFLLVNEKCYGTQLQTLLNIPLTPIQNALLRLEKQEILSSQYEGKIRFFHLNPLYPLRWELENLLKKAYALLPSEEKRKYSFIHRAKQLLTERERRDELQKFWERLSQVRSLAFSAKTKQGAEPSIRIGKAEVKVSRPSQGILVFQEKGYWLVDHFPDAGFSNVFRWTLDVPKTIISLEHLRYGTSRPVHLLHLTLASSSCLESIDTHLCCQDTYMGNISWKKEEICFHWKIIGPKKNDELIYRYM